MEVKKKLLLTISIGPIIWRLLSTLTRKLPSIILTSYAKMISSQRLISIRTLRRNSNRRSKSGRKLRRKEKQNLLLYQTRKTNLRVN